MPLLRALQFYSAPGSWINRMAMEGSDAVTSGFDARVRATGTFAYITGFGNFAIVALAAGIALLAIARSSRMRTLGAWATAAALVCAGTTFSRGVGLGAVGLLAGVALNSKTGTKALVTIIAVGAIWWGANLLAGKSSDTIVEILSAPQRRHAHVGSEDTAAARLFRPFAEWFEAIGIAPLGAGVGSEQVAGAYYARGTMAFNRYESEWPRLVMEFVRLGFLDSCSFISKRS